jgi:tetratricopeptide (TPR) repeat protein/NAD-dependent dihydropyrimidine dehydrogenase PreA subunit
MASTIKTDYGKWRAISLSTVYLLMGLHIAHWKLAGRTLAPLEFNEVLYTVHLGIITAGFIFMGLTMIATLVAGRFFCSWMCHMVALQDASFWLLKKMGIRAKHIRSRTLAWLPLAAVIYLFILPQIERAMTGQAPVSLHIANDSDGWASFVTTDFWRNLPSIGITLLTFIVCGGMVIYILGSRSFCQYACPYGMIFSLADRAAPGKIKLVGDCIECGKCTAVCSSHIQVQKEVLQFNRVVDTNCLKDMDCVQVCPENALAFGFAKPSGFLSLKKLKGFKKKYDFSIGEDGFLAISTFIFISIFRGLYDAIPFLLAITLGLLFAYGLIILSRLWRTDYVRISNFTLKRPHGITRAGKVFSVFMSLLLVFSIHSAIVHYYTYMGERVYNQLADVQRNQSAQTNEPIDDARLNLAFSRLKKADEMGLFHPASLQRELAALSILKNDPLAATQYLEKMLSQLPNDIEGRLKYGQMLILLDKNDEAATQLRQVIQTNALTGREKHIKAEASIALGQLREKTGLGAEAESLYKIALTEEPENAEAKLALGVLYTHTGQFKEAEQLLIQASVKYPNSAIIENNLAIIFLKQKKYKEAEEHLNAVNRIQPGNAQVMYNLAMLQFSLGRKQEAYVSMNTLLSQHPEHKNARKALMMMENNSENQNTGHMN